MLEAIFASGVDEIEVSGLTQWDRGRVLKITVPEGLPSLYQVHFAVRGSEKAKSVTVTDSTEVSIPDEVLMQPRGLIAYIYLTDNGCETVKKINLPLRSRAKPKTT